MDGGRRWGGHGQGGASGGGAGNWLGGRVVAAAQGRERVMAFPLGASVTLQALADEPYPLFARLQAEEPVTWCPALGMWLVVRWSDAVAVLQNRRDFTVVSERSLLADVIGPMMLSTDGSEQTRLRQPFAATYLPRSIAGLAEAVAARAEALVSAFAATGEADLQAQFAAPLALGTVLDSLGLPDPDLPVVRAWYADIATALSNYTGDPGVRALGQSAVRAFGEYVRARWAGLRPGSPLAAAAAAGLSEAEVLASAAITVFGGLETTAAMLGNTLWALLRHPDQLAAVRADPGLLPRAVDEGLRWESPVQTCTRHANREVEIAGVPVAAGDTVQCMVGAANRDSAHFPQPERFDVRRANADEHLAFGSGRHFCIGAALARLEGAVGLRVLLERLPALELVGVGAPAGHEFRSLAALRVRF